jgi:hypothetical protein
VIPANSLLRPSTEKVGYTLGIWLPGIWDLPGRDSQKRHRGSCMVNILFFELSIRSKATGLPKNHQGKAVYFASEYDQKLKTIHYI